MMFEILYDAQPVKFLKLQTKDVAKRIINKIDSTLTYDPVPADAKRIVGEHGVYRIRIGDYRAIYTIDYSAKKIVIFKIDRREKFYD